MRDYGRVYSSFWTGSTNALTDDGRLLALYLLSGPHGTLAGVCRLPDGYVCEDLRWPAERVAKGFAELLAKGFANRCGTTNWVWINKFLEWNKPENPNQWKAAQRIASLIPEKCEWRVEFQKDFARASGGPQPKAAKGSRTVSKRLPTQEQEQDDLDHPKSQEQEQETTKPLPAARGGAFSPSEIPGLDLNAWQTWVDYRSARKPAIRPVSMRAAAERLAAYGDKQLAVVKRSIADGYQGLIDPKLNGSGHAATPEHKTKFAKAMDALNNA
jgi:hypothetical protein